MLKYTIIDNKIMFKKPLFITGFIFLIIVISLYIINIILNGKINNNFNYSISTQKERMKQIDRVNDLISEADTSGYKKNINIIANPVISKSLKLWEDELGYMGANMHQQYGPGPDLGFIVKNKYDKDPIDILIIGDSYSKGEFSDLFSDNYSKRLEAMLNYDINGLYRVNVLATEKASFYRQSDWLTLERLKKYNPDIIILTYTMGRFMPTFYESKYCKEFNTCIKDNSGTLYNDSLAHNFSESSTKWRIIMCLRSESPLISNIFRKILYPYFTNIAEWLAKKYCNDERAKRGIFLPTERDGFLYYDNIEETVYFNDFKNYLKRISRVLDRYDEYRNNKKLEKIERAFFTLVGFREEFAEKITDDSDYEIRAIPFYNEYINEGFNEISIPNAKNSVIDLRTWEMPQLNGTSKDGEYCNYDCYRSENAINDYLEWFSKGAINHPLKYRLGSRIHKAYALDIYNYIINNKNLKKQKNNNSSIIENLIISDYSPGNLSIKNKFNEAYVGYKINDNIGNLDKYFKEIKPNCAKIDKPHAVLALDHSNIKNIANDEIEIYFIDGEFDNLMVTVENEDEKGVRFYKNSFLLNKKEYLSMKYDKNIVRIYLSNYDANCKDKNMLENFMVKIKVI